MNDKTQATMFVVALCLFFFGVGMITFAVTTSIGMDAQDIEYCVKEFPVPVDSANERYYDFNQSKEIKEVIE